MSRSYLRRCVHLSVIVGSPFAVAVFGLALRGRAPMAYAVGLIAFVALAFIATTLMSRQEAACRRRDVVCLAIYNRPGMTSREITEFLRIKRDWRLEDLLGDLVDDGRLETDLTAKGVGYRPPTSKKEQRNA